MAEAALNEEGQQEGATGAEGGGQSTEGQQKSEAAAGGQKTEAAAEGGQKADPLESGAEGQQQSSPSFPDNWRELMSGGDDKLLKQLQNFTDPGKVAKAFSDVRKKLGSGEYMRKLPEDATEEEVKTWRKENGIPDAPEGYELKLPSGFELEDDDKPIVESFKKTAHESNLPAEAVNAVMGWYAKFQEEQRTAMATSDAQHQEQAIQELRTAWPAGEYKANLNAGREVLQSVGEDFADWLFNARGPDGMAVGNHPGFRQFLAQVALEQNPAATLLPGGSHDLQGVTGRIDELEKYMRENRRAYNKDQAAQNELMRLYEARDKLSKK